MGTAFLVPAETDIISETATHLINISGDLSCNIVVFPGRRPAHFLRKKLAHKLGRGYIPPHIFSMDDFIDFIYENVLGIRNKKLSIYDAIEVIYSLKDLFFRDEYSSFSTEAILNVAIRLFRDLEELYIEDIDPERIAIVDTYIDYAVSEKTKGRIIGISKLYREFYRYLQSEGLSTRATRYRTVSEKVHDALSALKQQYSIEKVIITGFFGLTASEVRIFQELMKLDETILLFQNACGIENVLKRLSINCIQPQKHRRHKTKIQFISCPDTHAEVFALNGFIKDIKARETLDESTAIVLPSAETLMPMLQFCLSELDQKEYNISMGYPLARTPLYGFFTCLFELLNSMHHNMVYVPEYLRFIIHPYTKNIFFRNTTEPTRRLFHEIESYFLSERTRTFVTLQEIESLPFYIEALKTQARELSEHLKTIHQKTIKYLTSIQSIGDFARRLSEIIEYIYHNSTASRHPYFQPFAEAFLRSLDEIRSSRVSNLSLSGPQAYFNLFKRLVNLQRVPFEGTPLRGLQVLGFLETRNISFKRLFVLDCNEGILPPAPVVDSLLPTGARQSLGLSTYKDTESLIAYYFDLMIKAAEEVTILYVSDQNKQRSRLVETLLWRIQQTKKTPTTQDFIKTAEYNILLKTSLPADIPKDEEVLSILKRMEITPTAVDDYLYCPLNFFYKYILKLKTTDLSILHLNRADIGTMVHKILSEYFRPLKGSIVPDALSVERMHKLIEEYFKAVFGEPLIGRAYLIKRQVKQKLTALIEQYYIPLLKEQNVKLLLVEERLFTPYGDFKLTGIIDRVEKRDHLHYVLDYKTSARKENFKITFQKIDPDNPETWQKYIGSLQIPFYVLLYRLSRQIPLENIKGVYLLLGRRDLNPDDIELNIFNNTVEEFPLLQSIIDRLLKEMLDPSVPFYPSPQHKKRCPFCQFQDLCGTGWISTTGGYNL